MTQPIKSLNRFEFTLAKHPASRPLAHGIQAYGVVRGRPIQGKVAEPPGDSPHYHVLLRTANNQSFDAAINVLSTDGSEVLFLVETAFNPPHAKAWLALPSGATSIGNAGAGGIGVDFIREHLVTRAQMTLLPVVEGAANNLNDAITGLVQRAIADPTAEVFAFGVLYGAANSGGSNPVFGFSPDLGVHDIHMNQGNPAGPHGSSNGVYQDGALIVHYPSDGHWEAALIAFQSQSFQTSNTTGNPVA